MSLLKQTMGNNMLNKNSKIYKLFLYIKILWLIKMKNICIKLKWAYFFKVFSKGDLLMSPTQTRKTDNQIKTNKLTVLPLNEKNDIIASTDHGGLRCFMTPAIDIFPTYFNNAISRLQSRLTRHTVWINLKYIFGKNCNPKCILALL